MKDYVKRVWKTGDHGASCSVIERCRRGKKSYQLQIWNPLTESRKTRSLGHFDLKKAKAEARGLAYELSQGKVQLADRKVTLEQVLLRYLTDNTAKRSAVKRDTAKAKLCDGDVTDLNAKKKLVDGKWVTDGCGCYNEDHKRTQLFLRVFGHDFDPTKLDISEWKDYQRDRQLGVIDARGRQVAPGDRKPIGSRALEQDAKFLRAVFRHARFATWNGQPLLLDNPLPSGKNSPFNAPKSEPVQVAASTDRIDAIRDVADLIKTIELVDGKWVTVVSFFSEFFDIISETGRRLSAVRQLRYSDLHLERDKTQPEGAILWPGATDKQGLERYSPLTERSRAAIDRVLARRPVIGDALLFPSPKNPKVAISADRLREWLKKAEELAGLEPQRRTLWHAYRRAYVTRLTEANVPDAFIAAAGGWKDANTLRASYQVPDKENILAATLAASAATG